MCALIQAQLAQSGTEDVPLEPVEYDERGDFTDSSEEEEEEEKYQGSRASISERRKSRRISRRLSRSTTSINTKDKLLTNNEILEDLMEENKKLLAELEAQEEENKRLGVTAKKPKTCNIF